MAHWINSCRKLIKRNATENTCIMRITAQEYSLWLFATRLRAKGADVRSNAERIRLVENIQLMYEMDMGPLGNASPVQQSN